jgi:uncharacterized repeat protein (TIGR01451 family)
MTTVLVLARPITYRARVEGILRWAVLAWLAFTASALAQDKPVHWLNAGAMPPGAIGSLRLHRGGPLPGYFQPVRIRAPQGARIALAAEGGFSETPPGDVLVGLPIGPVYRLKVTEIPNNPGLEIFPTVEVIDRLYPPPGLALRYPIPIELTRDELELAARGGFVTRVIYVEDPHQALPIAQGADGEQPWIEAPQGEDPLVTADWRGRPAAILRIGGRVPNEESRRAGLPLPPFILYDKDDMCPEASPAEVYASHSEDAAQSNPRTFNADEALPIDGAPASFPIDSAAGCQACQEGACQASASDPYGPLVGPSDEYLCDGGDFGTPAGVRADWTVDGLEEEDAIAHYDRLDGRVVVTPSNRVCIYSPRFAAVRRVVGPLAHEQPIYVSAILEEEAPAKAAEARPVIAARQRHAVTVNLGERPPSLFRQREQAGGLENLQATMDAYASLAPYANLEIVRTGEVSLAQRPLLEKSIQSAITWTGDQAPQVVFGVKMAQGMIGVRQPGVIYQTEEPHSPRLRLIKLASTGHALPGEEVEFTLRFDNVGDQVIGNVTIVDNLSTRLEYIPDTAKSSVDANFLTEPNTSGSTIIRWEIKNPVEPGEGGILRFQAKVR